MVLVEKATNVEDVELIGDRQLVCLKEMPSYVLKYLQHFENDTFPFLNVKASNTFILLEVEDSEKYFVNRITTCQQFMDISIVTQEMESVM